MPVLCSCYVLGRGMYAAGEYPGAQGSLVEKLVQWRPNLLLLCTARVGIIVPVRTLEIA